jgi:hypothetical protein
MSDFLALVKKSNRMEPWSHASVTKLLFCPKLINKVDIDFKLTLFQDLKHYPSAVYARVNLQRKGMQQELELTKER